MSDRPNVVLICVDQWRGDCLSIAGHPVVQTPFLDHIASSGARFRRAYSATPSCIAARAALLTGMTQRNHGRVGYRDGIEWNYPVTLAGEFTRHGYQTQAVGKMHVYPARSQMGFQNIDLHDGYTHFGRKRSADIEQVDDYLPWLRQRAGHDVDYHYHGLNCNSYVARPWTMDENLHPTNYVTNQSIDFFRRRDTRKPFFLFMSYHRPHPPLDPPAWAFEQYVNRDMPEPPIGDWAELFAPLRKPFTPTQSPKIMAKEALQRARAGYYGHLSHIDHQVHRFMELLAEYGLGNNTYVCFVSDHGEMLGDHHLYAKSLPYEGSANVPLLLRGPGGSNIRPGEAHDQVVELRDVMPTLLECAGLPIPDSVDGRSFLPIAQGKAEPVREYLHGEHISAFGSNHYITDERYKYVWFSGTGHEHLFDLRDDPQELRDLARDGEHADRIAHYRRQLMCELDGREEGFTDGSRLHAGRPVKPYLEAVHGPQVR